MSRHLPGAAAPPAILRRSSGPGLIYATHRNRLPFPSEVIRGRWRQVAVGLGSEAWGLRLGAWGVPPASA